VVILKASSAIVGLAEVKRRSILTRSFDLEMTSKKEIAMSTKHGSWARVGVGVLVGAILAPAIASAQASTATGSVSVGWTVDTVCQVTGNSIDYGVFFANQTADEVRLRLGSWQPAAAVTNGTASHALTLATVTCPTNIPWNLAISGGALGSAAPIDVTQTVGTGDSAHYAVWPIAYTEDGNLVGSGSGVVITDSSFTAGTHNTTAAAGQPSWISGLGNGSAQLIVGGYYMNGSTSSVGGTGGTLHAGT
jgi:hypothetical protein